MQTVRYFVAGITVLVGVASAPGQPPTRSGPMVKADVVEGRAAEDRIDEFVRAEMQRQHVPGVAVAVVKGGKVAKLTGYGLANVEHQVPVRPETIFQSGSLGKQITAAAVMLLVEDGKIALSDSIAKYFPDAPETWKPITVRHLLTHTSGIADCELGSLNLRRDYSEDELARFAFRRKLEFPAGDRWNYSNTGYVLLGIIVHKASGQFYGDVLRDRVFQPLGMKTARVINEAEIVPNRAAGYQITDGELKNHDWVAPKLNTTADGSLHLSILDWIAWDRGLRSKAVLKPESRAQVFTPVKLNSGKSYPYGFGWHLDEIAGQSVQRHAGAWQGFKTYLARYLGDDMTIIVLCNLREANPERFVEGIAAIENPKLTPAKPQPIADHEPQVTERLKSLLAAAAEGRLVPDQFAYVRAGFFPDKPKQYTGLLKRLGPLDQIELIQRQELGDDRIYTYNVQYPKRKLQVKIGLAPDEKISIFEIR